MWGGVSADPHRPDPMRDRVGALNHQQMNTNPIAPARREGFFVRLRVLPPIVAIIQLTATLVKPTE